MIKTTKLVKFILIVMILIPVTLLLTGFIQTFIIKSKQQQLTNLQTQINNSKQIEQNYLDMEEYIQSEQYQEDYNKHENNKSQNNDIIVEVQEENSQD